MSFFDCYYSGLVMCLLLRLCWCLLRGCGLVLCGVDCVYCGFVGFAGFAGVWFWWFSFAWVCGALFYCAICCELCCGLCFKIVVLCLCWFIWWVWPLIVVVKLGVACVASGLF